MPAGKPAAGFASKLSCMEGLLNVAILARPLGGMYVAQPVNKATPPIVIRILGIRIRCQLSLIRVYELETGGVQTSIDFIRNSGILAGMKSQALSSPVELEKLKPILHLKIERMNGQQLDLLNRVLLQLEAEELANHLGESFDQDQEQGKLDRIAGLVREFRSQHRCS